MKLIFSGLENMELEERTILSVGSFDFVYLKPLKTFFLSSNVSNVLMDNFYNAAGQKVRKKVYEMTAPPSGTIKDVEYLDGFQYVGSTLNFFPTAEGYVSVTESNSLANPLLFNYVYNYTDHLGNIRFSYSKDPVSGVLTKMEENHYYPFGLKHGVYSGISMNYQLIDNLPGTEPEARPTYVYKTDYQYKYNGKEFQDELGLNWYDMDMRQYDPAIARWVVQDPITHHSLSPYNAFDNNPVFWADPSGANSEKKRSTSELIAGIWNATPEGGTYSWQNTKKDKDSNDSDSPPDDHFDQYGNYMYTDDKETNNIVIHKQVSGNNPFSPIDLSEMQIELKDYLFTNDSDFMLLVNIAAYYASFVDVNARSLHNGSFSIAAA